MGSVLCEHGLCVQPCKSLCEQKRESARASHSVYLIHTYIYSLHIFIYSQDPAVAFAKKGYHILLEKPMAVSK